MQPKKSFCIIDAISVTHVFIDDEIASPAISSAADVFPFYLDNDPGLNISTLIKCLTRETLRDIQICACTYLSVIPKIIKTEKRRKTRK